jgi:NTE family protein
LIGEESFVVVSDKIGADDGALPDNARRADDESLVGVAVRAVRDYPLVFIACGPDPPSVLVDGSDRVVLIGDDDYAPREQVVGGRDVLRASSELDDDGIAALARQLCGRRVGLALGAGAIRGFAHAGVLGVLAERKVPIDLVSGASAGAIAGALFLSGWPPRELASLLAASLETIQTGLPSLTVPPDSLLTGRRLLNYFRRKLGSDARIEDLPVPFIVAATDLDRREAVHLDSGPLPESIAASAAVPGVFPSVGLGGRRLVDGGVSDPVPVRALRERGADIVIAVNVMGVGTGGRTEQRPRLLNLPIVLENVLVLPGLLSNLLLGLDVIMSQIALDSCRWADVVISPSCPPGPRRRVVPAQTYRSAGERAALEAMPELTAILGSVVG